MGTMIQIQLGKNGVTESFIETLKNHFKKNKSVRISVLKSAREDGKKSVKEYRDKIIEKLGGNFKARTIGFVIIIKKIAPRFILRN